MNLTTLWHAVDDRLNQLDSSALADGFLRYRFALYTGREAWLAGPGAVRAQAEGAQASSPLTGFLR